MRNGGGGVLRALALHAPRNADAGREGGGGGECKVEAASDVAAGSRLLGVYN